MDWPGLESVRYADLLRKFLLARLDPPKRFRTLRIEPGGFVYGPNVWPLRSIVGVSMRSRALQSGTTARQLVDLLLASIGILGIAAFDAGFNQSAILNWFLSSKWATIFLILLFIKNAAPTVLAIIIGTILIALAKRFIDPNVGSEWFGHYPTALARLVSGSGELSRAVVLLTVGAATYASLSFLRFPWHVRDTKNFFRFPYVPRVLTDLSYPQLAIERINGDVLWIELKPYPFIGVEDREAQAQFGAAILSAFDRQLNARLGASVVLIDLEKRGMFTSLESAIDDIHEPPREMSLEENLRAAEASLLNKDWPVVEREIVLLWHDLERIAAPEARRMLRYIEMLQWFGGEDIANRSMRRLGFRGRPEDQEVMRQAKKLAKKAIRELDSHRSDEPLFWNIFAPYRTDGGNTRDTIVGRVGMISLWIERRIEELERPPEPPVQELSAPEPPEGPERAAA